MDKLLSKIESLRDILLGFIKGSAPVIIFYMFLMNYCDKISIGIFTLAFCFVASGTIGIWLSINEN